MNETHYLTAEGMKKMQKELEHLKGPKREEIARRLRIAIEQGDLSENADYTATKEEQGFVEGRIMELEQILRNAVVISKSNGKREEIDLGVRVTIQEKGNPPESYLLVGANEANPQEGRISHLSPIGQALMGKRKGDEVQVSTPNGTLVFKVIKIE